MSLPPPHNGYLSATGARRQCRVAVALRRPRTHARKPFAHAETPHPFQDGAFLKIIAGDHLISHTLTRDVPSAQRGLTSVFGMGTGVTLAVNSPANCRTSRAHAIVHN